MTRTLRSANARKVGTVVPLIVGAEDDVVLPEDCRAYTDTLQQRGVDARLTIEPGLGHKMLVTPAAFREPSTARCRRRDAAADGPSSVS